MPTRPAHLTPHRQPERKRSRQSSLPPHVAKLYSTARWQKRREWQLAREPLCRACRQSKLVTKATVADHVEQCTDEQTFWEGELMSLCNPCHQSKRQAESRRAKWQPKSGCSSNGMPLAPDHPWNREAERRVSANPASDHNRRVPGHAKAIAAALDAVRPLIVSIDVRNYPLDVRRRTGAGSASWAICSGDHETCRRGDSSGMPAGARSVP